MDIDEIRKLADLAIEKNLAEIEVAQHGTTVRIRRPEAPAAPQFVSVPGGMPAPPVATAAATAADTAEAGPQYGDAHMIKSPMVGTFYLAPEPGADQFTQLGDRVVAGQTLCIIEAMKLMNEITADVDGEVVAILQENAQPVEYGQELFAIRAD